MNKSHHPWSGDDLKTLTLHYGRFPVRFVAERLGRSELAVRIMASRVRKEGQRIEDARNRRNISREAV